ncbi:MAG: RluA family pseudouridine synthase [Lachnospiraceae bacterium]
MEQYIFKVDTDENNRIDKFLSVKLKTISRSHIQKLIREQNVLVNGAAVKANYKLSSDDQVEVFIPEAKEPDIIPEDIPLDVLYEDNDIIIINKPKGMVVHPAAGHYHGTLVNALLYHCSDLSGINGITRPGIVHRIDMDTTGSILVCKNDIAHQGAMEQFKNHTIKREYHAIVFGNLKQDTGTIDGPIGRHPVDRKKMCINEKNGRAAITHYEVLQRFGAYTYIKCRLETGRTHQIRVHMASIHHPLLGDTVYGPQKQPFHTQGQVLHARLLGITHPVSGVYLEVDAPLPDYFVKLLAKLGEVKS